MAPDGGPWAPVLFDPETVAVEPREVRPGEAVSVRFRFRAGMSSCIRDLRFETRPGLVKLSVTEQLVPETGEVSFVIPGNLLDASGTYELRLHMVFEWTDGVTYQRAPPFGSLKITPFAGHVYSPERFAAEQGRAVAAGEEVAGVLGELGALPRARGLLEGLSDLTVRALEAHERGRDPEAKSLLEQVLRDSASIRTNPEAAIYRDDIARFSRSLPDSSPRPVLTLLTGGGSALTDADFGFFRELGVGVVLARTPEQAALLSKAGFESVATRAPVRFTAHRAETHLSERQHRYLLSEPIRAGNAPLVLDPLSGFVDGHYECDTSDSARHWRVLAEPDGRVLGGSEWSVEGVPPRVLIPNPEAGIAYRVAVLVQAADVPFFHRFADPFHPECAADMMRRLTKYLDSFAALDIYRPTSLFYPFPKIDQWVGGGAAGRRRVSWHNFYGYQWGVSPPAQRRFAEETGIAFDPIWMVDGGRYGDINYPPRDEYRAWMAWQQQTVKGLAGRLVEAAHGKGIRVRVFWGDHWLGMEPYAGFFDETGCDEIVKACKSATVVRMTVDFPGTVKRVIRFSPWFSEGELFGRRDPPAFMDRCWADIKRGALFRMPDGLSWGGETQTIGFKDTGIRREVASMASEFRVMYALLGGRDVFTHDLDVGIVTSWGALRSWCTWLQVNESQQVLTHLTDLPVRVHFLSFSEVLAGGIPAGIDVLVNCGEPHSAWSGGEVWRESRLVGAVTEFVRSGGGLIGIGAPSHLAGAGWQLSELFGVDFEDSMVRGQGDTGAFSRYDEVFLNRGRKPVWTGSMRATPGRHWITSDLGVQASNPVLTKVRASVVAEDTALICSGDGTSPVPPIATVRGEGRGRVVYLNGYSSSSDYGSLLRRAVFWAAGREASWGRLCTSSPDVLVYLYPSESLLVVYNTTRLPCGALVRVDLSLLPDCRSQSVEVEDMLTGGRRRVSRTEFASGLGVELAPHAVSFLRIGGVSSGRGG